MKAAATLGRHRALLDNGREGCLETFRSCAQPDGDWVEEVARQLQASRADTPGGS